MSAGCFFENLEKNSLKLKPCKCEFFKKTNLYLDHMVSAEGIHMDSTKTETVMNWLIP